MTDTAKFWPGGIPAYIRCHNEPIKEGLDEEIKGWQLYIDVCNSEVGVVFKSFG